MNAHCMEFIVKKEAIDEFNHMNNKVYINYLETARIAWHEHIGFGLDKMIDQGYGDVLRNINISFIKEALVDEKLTIKTFPQSIGKTSFVIKQHIFNEKNEMITEAEAVIVIVNLKKRVKTQIPENLANKINQLINK